VTPNTPDPNTVHCSRCGCLGNMSCGHEPLDKEKCCTLDQLEVCPCCRAKEAMAGVDTWTRWDVQCAVNDTCSCGGKGPQDGCCPACEVWHRLNGREVKSTPQPLPPETCSATLLQTLKWNLWWCGPLHGAICWYLRRCAGAFHHMQYGPDGKYVVLMSDEQYHRYGKMR
jgi:hypothetical protein